MRDFTKKREFERKLRKAAGFVFLERTLKKGFQALRIPMVEARKSRLVKERVSIRVGRKCLETWILHYMRADIEKRVLVRKNQSTIWKRWQNW